MPDNDFGVKNGMTVCNGLRYEVSRMTLHAPVNAGRRFVRRARIYNSPTCSQAARFFALLPVALLVLERPANPSTIRLRRDYGGQGTRRMIWLRPGRVGKLEPGKLFGNVNDIGGFQIEGRAVLSLQDALQIQRVMLQASADVPNYLYAL